MSQAALCRVLEVEGDWAADLCRNHGHANCITQVAALGKHLKHALQTHSSDRVELQLMLAGGRIAAKPSWVAGGALSGSFCVSRANGGHALLRQTKQPP